MDIDLSQFSQVFFEESIEGLAIMESELLKLDVATPDPETINTIFRAAHSIKGGSATFGFTQVANYTHLLETLLDEIRDGRRQMQPEHVDILLLSVDLLRGMFEALMSQAEFNDPKLPELELRLNHTLANQPTQAQSASTPSASTATQSTASCWQIDFKAGADIMRCGNDPMLMFAELASKGPLTAELLPVSFPVWDDFDPEACYLHWRLALITDEPLAKLKEVFEWVEDECEISYNQAEAAPAAELAIPEQAQPPQPEVDMAVSAPEVIALVPEVPASPSDKAVASQKQSAAAKSGESSSIRVSTEKIDMLINMVGELVITQAMLGQIGQQDEINQESLLLLQQGLEQLASHTRDLQESVMQIRMLPISFAFNRFPRLVRDIGQQLGKKVELILKGEDTELDKTVLEKIVDPMVHLVRNSLDHGLESPEVRLAQGKPETGTIMLNAYHQGGCIIIEIADDGAGLNTGKILQKARQKGLVGPDEELSEDAIHQLIFKPGFSTADAVSDLSGRGVGMDVVKRNIHELNGSIELKSDAGKGSRFTIRLPLTLAILDGQLVRIGKHIYVVPLVSIYESLQVPTNRINRLSDGHELIRLRDEYLPVIKMYREFNHDADAREIKDGLVMVVDHNNEKTGLLVDELLAQQQVVIKSLEENYTRIPGISGATILGDGTVALIIDVAGLVKLAGIGSSNEHAA
ncbi:chemotaxis protein CheA [Shewanella litorisediminis]|uniref:Chemotaxis protein CheA n=1 Tax=Shewanella litorisediminis TaxID=1173586 RepID=A0ABX7G333_9GAMM|nr:chemotaxis protein CheA [Shewanella litorisediminis]MCL2917233.1 chemotaxis protein CheA [Shewanella litorisediminis]QRH01707.1 chemotaxis protein CheA [Shewanella litorisediminis]